MFGLHVLSLEDVLDPNQRPKVEHYDYYTFVVLKLLGMSTTVEVHPLYILIGERFVVDLARRARQDLQIIRHAVCPAREAVTSLRRDDDPRVSDETRVYLRDCSGSLLYFRRKGCFGTAKRSAVTPAAEE